MTQWANGYHASSPDLSWGEVGRVRQEGKAEDEGEWAVTGISEGGVQGEIWWLQTSVWILCTWVEVLHHHKLWSKFPSCLFFPITIQQRIRRFHKPSYSGQIFISKQPRKAVQKLWVKAAIVGLHLAEIKEPFMYQVIYFHCNSSPDLFSILINFTSSYKCFLLSGICQMCFICFLFIWSTSTMCLSVFTKNPLVESTSKVTSPAVSMHSLATPLPLSQAKFEAFS